MVSVVPAGTRVTVAVTPKSERLDRTNVAGRPEEQYHAVDDTSCGATALAPAAAGNAGAARGRLIGRSHMGSERARDQSSHDDGADDQPRHCWCTQGAVAGLARPRSSGSLIWLTHLALTHLAHGRVRCPPHGRRDGQGSAWYGPLPGLALSCWLAPTHSRRLSLLSGCVRTRIGGPFRRCDPGSPGNAESCNPWRRVTFSSDLAEDRPSHYRSACAT